MSTAQSKAVVPAMLWPKHHPADVGRRRMWRPKMRRLQPSPIVSERQPQWQRTMCKWNLPCGPQKTCHELPKLTKGGCHANEHAEGLDKGRAPGFVLFDGYRYLCTAMLYIHYKMAILMGKMMILANQHVISTWQRPFSTCSTRAPWLLWLWTPAHGRWSPRHWHRSSCRFFPHWDWAGKIHESYEDLSLKRFKTWMA